MEENEIIIDFNEIMGCWNINGNAVSDPVIAAIAIAKSKKYSDKGLGLGTQIQAKSFKQHNAQISKILQQYKKEYNSVDKSNYTVGTLVDFFKRHNGEENIKLLLSSNIESLIPSNKLDTGHTKAIIKDLSKSKSWRGRRFSDEVLYRKWVLFNTTGGAEERIEDIDFTFTDPDGKSISFNNLLDDILSPVKHGKLQGAKVDNDPGSTKGTNMFRNKYDTNKSDRFMKMADTGLARELTLNGLLGYSDEYMIKDSLQVLKQVPSIFDIVL